MKLPKGNPTGLTTVRKPSREVQNREFLHGSRKKAPKAFAAAGAGFPPFCMADFGHVATHHSASGLSLSAFPSGWPAPGHKACHVSLHFIFKTPMTSSQDKAAAADRSLQYSSAHDRFAWTAKLLKDTPNRGTSTRLGAHDGLARGRLAATSRKRWHSRLCKESRPRLMSESTKRIASSWAELGQEGKLGKCWSACTVGPCFGPLPSFPWFR